MNERQRVILNYVRLRSAASQRGLTIREIARATGLTPSPVWHHVRRLAKAGLVTMGDNKARSIRAVVTGTGPDLRECETVYH